MIAYKAKFAANLFLLSLVWLLAACATPALPAPDNKVDPTFREFYDIQGGEELLGKPLGVVMGENNLKYQFLENAVLIYNPAALPGERLDFLAVGNLYVTPDSLTAMGEQPGIRLLGGHIIYDEFIPVFDRLGGVRFVGNPLTEVRKNTEQGRYEQFFEKLGFYRNFADPAGTVRLLPYGLIACQERAELEPCGNLPNARIQDFPPEPFLPIIQRLGEDFFGKALSAPSLAADGQIEQVYENVVLAVNPQSLRQVELRPLPGVVGFQPHAWVPPRNEPGLTFYPKNGSLGYNVAQAFVEYVVLHGGSEISGEPTTELFLVNGVRRQCFEKYCLDYDPSAPAGAQIRPAPLGYEYQRLQGYTLPEIGLQVWEQIDPQGTGEALVVGAMLYNGVPSQPLENIQPTLTVWLQGEYVEELLFPPTSTAGLTYLPLKLEGLQSRQLVQYEVCVQWPGADEVCMRESWLVK
jgi:hypothetical protein